MVIGTVPVYTWAVVDRPQRNQAIGPGLLQMPPAQDGVGSFQAQQVTDGKLAQVLRLCRSPKSGVSLYFGAGAQLHHLSAFFHGAIPCQLPLRLRPRLLRTAPAGQLAESA